MKTLQPLNIPKLLREHSLHPSKGLGQNYLVDEQALQEIITAAGIHSTDSVLEIGPGLGSLTRYLALAAQSVKAVELDEKVFPLLESILEPFPNVQVIHGDILQLDPGRIMNKVNYLVVANIPYNITSVLFRHLLECEQRPTKIVLTIQKEVAERICAKPGKLSILALSVQVYGRPHIHATIPASSFYPPPKVDSAIISVEIFPQPIIPKNLLEPFFQLVKAGFSQKRKTLRNSLTAGLNLPASQVEERLKNAEIDPMRRAETLTLPEWEKLTRLFTLGKKDLS